MIDSDLSLLRLLQFADSALPVGGAAQSYGIETLIAEQMLDAASLEEFLGDVIGEGGTLEAWFCRAGHALGSDMAHGQPVERAWETLNARLSALRPGREARTASLMMGQRLLRALAALEGSAVPIAKSHYCVVFGCCGGVLDIAVESVILAYLHQNLAGMISACQRLLPLGQTEAMRLAWVLKRRLQATALHSRRPDPPPAFMPMLDIGSMRHPELPVRLFMS